MKEQSTNKFNRRERRTAAQHLRGLDVCTKCLLLEICYESTTNTEEARKKYKSGQIIPKIYRETHKEMCERLNMEVY